MHTLVEVPVGTNGGTHVPAFLAKLWKIVDDPSTNDLICWSDMGNSFIIKNQAKFARDLLPLYYKHNNMASFVRQLNMYGFHKVVSVEQGGLRVDKDEMEFAHPFFLKGQEASLELIKRKIPASKHEESRMRPDSLNKVLLDVRQMKGRQESMDNKLITMKRENEALWRELASLRQKHAKQTQIVSKLLQFLVGMMSQQTPRLAFKRRMPLMLNDKDGLKQKLARTDGEPTGPVIHDVTELLESDESEEMDQECVISAAADALKADSLNNVANMAGGKNSSYPETIVGGGGGRLSPDSPEMMFSVNPIAVNPAVAVPGNNTLQQQQGQNQNVDQNKQAVVSVKARGKQPAKNKANSSAVAASIPSVKSETNNVVAFPTSQQAVTTAASTNSIHQAQQLLQMPASVMNTLAAATAAAAAAPQAQNNVQVPTTLFFSAPGMSEPVQVVLSLPDQATTTSTIPSMNNITSPIIVPSTSSTPAVTMSAVNKQINIQPQQQPSVMASGPVPITTTTNKMGGATTTTTNGTDVIGRSQSVNPKTLMKNGSSAPQDLDGHLDDMEAGLNNLRDLFKTDEYSVDNDTLIGVSDSMQPYFSLAANDPQSYAQLFEGSPPSSTENTENQQTTQNHLQLNLPGGGDGSMQGQEVVAYNPSLFELAEDDSNFFDESSNIFLDDELESMLTTDRDSLKRPEPPSHNRSSASGVGGQISFSGINLNNCLNSGLHTPVGESAPSTPGTSTTTTAATTGASKRKRK